MGISQEELARNLGVSFATVNRWENGKCQPSRMAEKVIREFCAANQLATENPGKGEADENQ